LGKLYDQYGLTFGSVPIYGFTASMEDAREFLGFSDDTNILEFRIESVLVENDLAWVNAAFYLDGKKLPIFEMGIDDQPTYRRVNETWYINDECSCSWIAYP